MFKKKYVAVVVLGSVVVGGTQTYAATLDSGIFGMIQSGFANVIGLFNKETEAQLNQLNEAYKAKVTQYVSDKTKEITSEMKQYKETEIQRADKELATHYNELVANVNAASKQELDVAKNDLSKKVDTRIAEIKKAMENEMKIQLQQQLR